MIDHEQIEQLLQNSKLNSTTDVIHFILDNIVKIINFEPLQDIALRVAQLQKPQGLDRIMIQQVKTLTEAIIQQKQEQIKRDLEKTVLKNVTIALDQQNMKHSLREMDLIQYMSKQNSRKSLQSSQFKPVAPNYQQTQLQAMRREISEIKIALDRKLQKRQMSDFKIDIQKDLSNKITTTETEMVIEKFQKEIFNKMTDLNNFMQKMEYDVKKSLMEQASEIKKQFYESAKMIDIRQRVCKTQKKVKKCQSQSIKVAKQTKDQISAHKKQSKQSLEQLCNLIENIEAKMKSNSNQIRSLSQEVNLNCKIQFQSASWLAEKNSLKNMSICWEKQLLNQNQQVFRFQAGKSQIIITEPGFYKIQSLVTGCEKQPQFYLNSQAYCKFREKQTGKTFGYCLDEIIKTTENVNKIWVKLNSDTNYSHAFIRVLRIG